ncbi:(S)-2-hydroxy-acid oxidase [Colletotrichum truncatum]|uniref:(S)-2-hydroxy-acid oxidase n=1 Tax=Colletotrichum truncatum TaxID=5467 RepID=A0ACC3YUX8_COLTU|nr:(S)-2-hydroxy-acid oxidase [Colletotrichum truncatum]KAF6785909.1 (S)-2-hydroxy-acid oxidase [Colletotrichum truncatum]
MTERSEQDLILSVEDVRIAAAKKLSSSAREFYDAGSTGQVTVKDNTAAYSKYRLLPRVLVDVSEVDTGITLFGQKIDFPLCVSPAGVQAMAHPDGELATSKACARRNVHMGISSFCNYPVEEVRAAGLDTGPIQHVMQLYTMRDRDAQLRIIRRAEKAGCVAIFLTADSPVLGVRYNEPRNQFRIPEGLSLPMFERTSETIRATTHEDGFDSINSNAHSWAKEIPWLRSVTKMQIWIKGILTEEDVELAIQYKCDGIIVSNHGGRQLDETPATIDVLPHCVKAAKGRIPVHIDGGVRSGTDIFKALALGAQCVWIGRPMIWGLAYDGEAGVTKVLDIMYGEFKRCMQLCGCTSIADITPASLGVVQKYGPLARL